MKYMQLLTMAFVMTVQPVMAQKTMELWPNGVPGPVVCKSPEKDMANGRVSNISDPTLTVYLPGKEHNTGTAVVICPGGGYIREAMNHEGHDFARYLKQHGIAGIVLKYRLPYGHPDIPLQDAQHAIRTVRANAQKWGIDPNKIGIAGFSAGGHLAATAETHFDAGKPNAHDPVERESCRPDFAILGYPVVTMKKGWTHMGSRINLLGKNPSKELVEKYSDELQVTPQTPPTFIFLRMMTVRFLPKTASNCIWLCERTRFLLNCISSLKGDMVLECVSAENLMTSGETWLSTGCVFDT